LESRFPGVVICGRLCPAPAPLHEMDSQAILAAIAAAKPDILLVAFGNPKQEMWIHRHRERLAPMVAIGIGGALDMIAGSLVRAPKLVQDMQMEWLFRMAQEPKRLLPRYYHDFVALCKYLPALWAANKLQPEERRHGTLEVEETGRVRVICTPARLSGSVTSWLVREATEAVEAGQTVVVDMSATLRVEADGVGALLEARRLLLDHDLWIWLCGMSNPVRRFLQFSSTADLFRIATTPSDAVRYSLAMMSGDHKAEPHLVRPAASQATQSRIAKAS
jgi:N-acetylglucosaminyldiphosphoundecaprenol N-acetyl-beta-D-mannosaminyltransferase